MNLLSQISHALLQSLQFSYFDFYCTDPVKVFVKVYLANGKLKSEVNSKFLFISFSVFFIFCCSTSIFRI